MHWYGGGVACSANPEPGKEAKTFTISFDVEGVDAITVKEGETAESQKPADPTKDGYSFECWQNGDAAYDWTQPVTSDLSLTAKWTLAEYTITYLPEGVVTDNPTTYNIESDTITLNDPTTCPSATPNFLEWRLNDENGAVVTEIAKGSTGNKIIYANCTAKNVYKVTFKLGEEVIGKGKNVTEGEKLTDFTGYEKYEFIDEEGKAFNFETPITSNIDVYLKLKSLKVTLTLAEGVSTELPVNYGEKITQAELEAMTSKIPEEYSSYDFEGLFTDAALENVFDWDNTAITENKVLYVKLVKYHTVKFIDGDNTSSIRVADGKVVKKPADPKKLSYKFIGWKDSSGAVYSFDSVVKSNLELTAEWEQLPPLPLWAPKDTAVTNTATLPGWGYTAKYEEDTTFGKVLSLDLAEGQESAGYCKFTIELPTARDLSSKVIKLVFKADGNTNDKIKPVIYSTDGEYSEHNATNVATASADWEYKYAAVADMWDSGEYDNNGQLVTKHSADKTQVKKIELAFQSCTANLKIAYLSICDDYNNTNEEIIWSANALSVEDPASWSNATVSYVEDATYGSVYKVETTSEVNYPITNVSFPSPAKDFSAYEYLQITLKASSATEEKLKVSIFTDDAHGSEHNGCNIATEDVGQLKSISLKLADFWTAYGLDEAADLSKISNLKIEFGKYVGTVEIAEISLY